MIKENKEEFEKSNLIKWHDEGYKGQGITIVVLDDRGMPLEQDNVIVPFPEEHREYDHNSSVCNVIRQVAPNVRIISMPWFGGIKKEIIDWIVERKDEIDIINCSFAGVVGVDEFNRLKDLDIPVICASGNAGKDDWISKPASYDWTIAIGAVGEANGHVTWYSNKGEELYAVAYTNIYILNSKGELFMFGGTSCSSPFACGLVACYLSWRKENNLRRLNKEEVREFIGINAFDMYELGHDYKSGYGLVMLPETIPTVDNIPTPTPEPPKEEPKEPEKPKEEEPIKEVTDVIIDISHHQLPSKIDYDKLSKHIKFAIIRTQYGSRLIDSHYKTHHAELRKRGVPTAAYAWVRGINEKDMEIEATDFYNRTKDIKPTFWFLDVEEESMNDMRNGIKAYVKKLRELGANKVGVYIGHHLYEKFNLDMNDFDAIWIPHYGINDGTANSKPKFYCDIHQYTSTGRVEGYDGNLDLNRLLGPKDLSFFTQHEEYIPPTPEKPKDYFNDDNNKWHEEFNNKLAELGIIKGDGKGNVRPDDNITRGEVNKIASLLYDVIMKEVEEKYQRK